MDESIEKCSGSPMLQAASSSPPRPNIFDNHDYSLSCGENSPLSGPIKPMTIVDGRFFKMIPGKCMNNTTVATCVKCEPRCIEIKGNINSSSNFLCHLKRKHGSQAVQEYTEYLHSKKRYKRSTHPYLNESTRQMKLRAAQTHKELEENILKFIVNSLLPMETVTNSYFLNIFKSLNVPEQDLKILNREFLNGKLEDLFHRVSEQLKAELKDASEICYMANIWQKNDKLNTTNCLVTMAHWIDGNMMRRSAVLAVKKLFHGELHDDSLKQILDNIRGEFNIKNTELYSSTIETCNLFEALTGYGVEKDSIIEDFEDTVDDGITEMNSLLVELKPRYLSCYVQILSNFASFDIAEIILNCEMSNPHNRVMKKCNILWNYSEAADIIDEIAGITLVKPSAKTWISLYNALGDILSIRDKAIEIYQTLEIKDYLHDMDFLYIEEHLECTKPLADALAILDCSKHTLFGSLLPALLALRRHLNKLCNREWTFCGPLVEALIEMVDSKFESFFEFETNEAEQAAIAALSHPEFKNRWLCVVDVDLQTKMLESFKLAVEKELPETQLAETDERIVATATTAANVQPRSEFFDFGTENKDIEPMASKEVVDMQVLNYFNYTSRSFDSLKHFPEIHKVFMKYNAPLSNFSMVHRMIDRDVMQRILGSNRHWNKHFEMELWLKVNEHLF